MYANLLESCVAKLEVTSGGLAHAGRSVAVLDAVARRTEREMLRMRGIVGGDELRAAVEDVLAA